MNRAQKGLLFAVGVGAIGYACRDYIFDKGGEMVENNAGGANVAVPQTNQAKFYGVTGGNSEILNIIDEVTRFYSFGANQNNLSRFLFEICAVESDFGWAIDKTFNSGEGLTQFDRATYNELRNDAIKNQWIMYKIRETEYNQLRYNPQLQIWMCRYFLWKRIPSAIPADIKGRAEQWKKYYNTHLGAGTVQGYISKANKWYNKIGYKGV